MNTYTTRSTCRACGGKRLQHLFSLGDQYVNDFVSADKIKGGILCPIDIDLCLNCTLVQQRHTAPQELLYTRHYWYRSGTTATMRRALESLAYDAIQREGLESGDAVLDIGSNDGTLLRSFKAFIPGIETVGVEPAENLANDGCRGADLLIKDFWSIGALPPELRQRKFKIVTAIGMAYDLEDPNQFFRDISLVLAPDGVLVLQLMCLKNMLDLGDVGNFAHEHLEFYSLNSLRLLLGKYGLEMFDLETNDVNGRSYRIFARHMDRSKSIGHALNNAFADEARLSDPDAYVGFVSQMESNRIACRDFISDAVSAGKRVWVYGASTKGNVILQHYGLDYRLIEAAADKSPEKWGKCTVGTGIPIKSEEEFRTAKPDFALVLPYAFLPEFIEREREWLAGGGKFLVPLPEFKVVS